MVEKRHKIVGNFAIPIIIDPTIIDSTVYTFS